MKSKRLIDEEVLNIPADVILENARDSFHVDSVHSTTIKNVDILFEEGDVSVLIYTLYVFPKLKLFSFLTKKFVVVKSSPDDKSVEFIAMPLNLKFASKFTIACESVSASKTIYATKFIFKPFGFVVSMLAPMLLKLRTFGEKQRLLEDIELMQNRLKAKKEGHVDKPQCTEKIPLEIKWFKD